MGESRTASHVRVFPAATTSLNGDIYVIGGYDNFGPTKRVDVYTPAQDKWRTLLPTQVVHVNAAAATGRHKIFVVGGGASQFGEPIATVKSRASRCGVCQ
jgi:hypothetical protein